MTLNRGKFFVTKKGFEVYIKTDKLLGYEMRIFNEE
jgi:hypothetical protein